MSLTEEDFKALRLLMREEINDAFEQRFEPFRNEVNERFREVDRRFDGLYAQNEKREQEYLSMTAQLDRIEKTVDRHDRYFDDLDNRVAALEKKSA